MTLQPIHGIIPIGETMPEGPEVRVIGDIINKAQGRTILKSTHTQNKKYKWLRDGIPGWDFLINKPWIVEDVNVKGKLIRINIIHETIKMSILSTLGLEGTWIWNLTSKDKNYKHKRIWFDFENGDQLAYYDSRNFGTLRIMSHEEADSKFNDIGWDLLQSSMPDEAWSKLKDKTAIKNKSIGEALMMQNFFSGIGNIYKAEILYELKIHPCILVRDLDYETWESINKTAHQILKKSYLAKGSSVDTYKGGSFQRSLQVYKKKECPLRHPIVSIKQAQRTTWCCETCQPQPILELK